ncbi:MAG: hypothetical protein WCS77_00640 [Elusimicrobiaceae bacterium]
MTESNFRFKFKLPSGAEFEAEGTQDFINKERETFLQILDQTNGSTPRTHGISRTPSPPSPAQKAFAKKEQNRETGNIVTSITNSNSQCSETDNKTAFQDAQELSHPVASDNNAYSPQTWSKVIIIKDNSIILKTKYPGISPEESALIIMAGAKLLSQKNGLTALELANSLRKSGFLKGRLDRILQPEIAGGRITSTGTKRGREYSLTNSGFVRACKLTVKIASESET